MLKLFLILSVFTGSLYASIGSITKTLGDVYIIRDMKSQKVKVGDEVLIKDLLFSRSKSKVQITFIDETVISIGQKSSFLIEEYVFDEENTANSRCSFKFSKGSFRSVSGKIGKIAKENFKLKTKNANISIKGTINGGVVRTDASGVTTTTTYTDQGATEVTGQNGAPQLVGAGMANNVIGSQPAFRPFQLPAGLMAAFNMLTDPTTRNFPNLPVMIQQNSTNNTSAPVSQSGGSTSGTPTSTSPSSSTTATTPPQTNNNTSGSVNNFNNVTLTPPATNNLASANLPGDLDNENSWGGWENVSPTSENEIENTITNEVNNTPSTLEDIVQGFINDTVSQTLIFTGDVSSVTTSDGATLLGIVNQFAMELDLGGGTNNFVASITFDDSYERVWDLLYFADPGGVTSSGFTGNIDSFFSTSGAGDIISGSISGSYSGTSSITGVSGTMGAVADTGGATISVTGTFQGIEGIPQP